MPSDARERVLASLREMPEVDLHTRVVLPVLKAIGATHISYEHGPFERGKDFIYIVTDHFGQHRLAVCQVKNERFSGKATSSSSVAGTLTQLLQCRKVKVLNPITQAKELPHEVALITTFPLPDAPLADGEHLLDEVKTTCMVIGPTILLDLLEQNTPGLFAELAFPGEGVIRAIRRHVVVHHEAAAFETAKHRSLDQFFVNLGFRHGTSGIQALIADSKGRVSEFHGVLSIAKHAVTALNALYQNYLPLLQSPLIVPSATKPTRDNVHSLTDDAQKKTAVPLDHVSILPPPVHRSLSEFADFLTHQGQLHIKEPHTHSGLVTSTLNAGRAWAEIMRLLTAEVGGDIWQQSTPSEWERVTSFAFRDIDPLAILGCDFHVCITGGAGAGKTCFSRSLVGRAIDQGKKCVYFPASRIVSAAKTLQEEMQEFFSTLISVECDWEAMWKQLDLIVIDGCDEAATFGTKLADDIQTLCFPGPIEIALPNSSTPPMVIPVHLHEKVRERKHRSSRTLVLLQPLSPVEFAYLKEVNSDPECRAWVEQLKESAGLQRPQIVLTSRSATPLNLSSLFSSFKLTQFDDTQLAEFFEKWFLGNATQHARDVIAFLNANPHVKEICRTPMTATIVAALHENGFALPHSRTDVYQKRFDLLLQSWDRVRSVAARARILPADKLHMLSRMALHMHLRNRRDFSRKEFDKLWHEGMHLRYPGINVDDVLGELENANSVIFSDSVGTYTLGHLSYQEFLAAREIVFGQRLKVLSDKLFNPWWRQVFIFYSGIAGNVESLLRTVQESLGLGDPDNLLEEMFAEARFTPDSLHTLIDELRDEYMDDDVYSEGPRYADDEE